jgi:hypothetical protein
VVNVPYRREEADAGERGPDPTPPA